MSTLYISTTGSAPGSTGVWRVSSSDYQYVYSAFTAGEDVNLDQVSVSTNTYDAGQSAPSNFQVGIYSGGVNSSTPGSLISYLSGPGSPTAGAYNSYTPTTSVTLNSGTQYWLGFTIASDNGGNNLTRVKINQSNGSTSYLSSGWSYGQRYVVGSGAGLPANDTKPATFQIYGTGRAVCFCSGTLIETPSGEKSIDEIKIGDIVRTSHGDLPVKWVAKRCIKRALMTKEGYQESLPTRINAGSLGNQRPTRDLLVSGSHGLFVDGKIVNACFLENGVNIYKDLSVADQPEIKYFHLEFDDEVLVTANGVAACSYVNHGNRRTFDNYPEFIRLYLDADSSVGSCIAGPPRNQPSLAGHKRRVRRSWQNDGLPSATTHRS